MSGAYRPAIIGKKNNLNTYLTGDLFEKANIYLIMSSC